MLSILHRYVLWELVRSFVISFAALVGIMLLGALYRPLRLGIGLGDIARLVPLLLPHLYAWVLPAALLSACVMAYGRLSADNEIQAICTSGVPLRYVCYPALVLALALTSLAVPLNDWVIPQCSVLKEQELRRIFLKEPFRVSVLDTEMTTTIGGYKVYVGSREGDTLYDVVLIEPKGAQRPRKRNPTAVAEPAGGQADAEEEGPEITVYRAKQAHYSFDKNRSKILIKLQDAQCVMVLPGRSARQWIEIRAEEQMKEIPVAGEEVMLEKRQTMTTRELLAKARERRADLAAGRGTGKYVLRDILHIVTQVRLREALAFSVLALAFVGVPIGIWMRRQSRLASFAVAILIFLALYAMIVGGEGLALEQRLPPSVALWTPDALMAAFGLALLLRTFRH